MMEGNGAKLKQITLINLFQSKLPMGLPIEFTNFKFSKSLTKLLSRTFSNVTFKLHPLQNFNEQQNQHRNAFRTEILTC